MSKNVLASIGITERPTTHVTGAILFFGAVSFDVVIISAERYGGINLSRALQLIVSRY